MTSSRPYLLRGIYEWIGDNHCTPHILVDAEVPNVQVPPKFIVDNKIILNISADATAKLIMNNEAIEFDARFGEAVWHVYVPLDAVLAIYARENGRGMAFTDDENTDNGGEGEETPPSENTSPSSPAKGKLKPGRPQLKIVK
jgi:stringent starvation protein B